MIMRGDLGGRGDLVRSGLKVILGVAACFLPVFVRAQEDGGLTSKSRVHDVRTNMATVARAFQDLQPYLVSREKFESPENEKAIAALLETLSAGFHRIESAPPRFRQEPGFAGTLTLLNDLLADSRNRFDEGSKGYVLWRLRNSVDYCVTCHTRYEVKVDFLAPEPEPAALNSYQRAEFLLATRQFEAAAAAFLRAVHSPPNGHLRIDALRRWLLIYTRVHPEPQKALRELTGLRKEMSFSKPEDEEIQGWLESLRRWSNESRRIEVTPIRRAEHLIQQALALKEPLVGRNGTVELFRATAILHQLLEDGRPEAAAQRARALRLLGVAYSEIPFLFVSDLPELFLEECIREFAGSEDARKAFQLYQHLVTLEYTGSGGTGLPTDVEATLRELYGLAYKSSGENEFSNAPGRL
jgi:hypothetical protein